MQDYLRSTMRQDLLTSFSIEYDIVSSLNYDNIDDFESSKVSKINLK